jgi:hypothetical protein
VPADGDAGKFARDDAIILFSTFEHSGNHLETRDEATPTSGHTAKSSVRIDEVRLGALDRNLPPGERPVLFASKCEQEKLIRRERSAFTFAAYQEIDAHVQF